MQSLSEQVRSGQTELARCRAERDRLLLLLQRQPSDSEVRTYTARLGQVTGHSGICGVRDTAVLMRRGAGYTTQYTLINHEAS